MSLAKEMVLHLNKICSVPIILLLSSGILHARTGGCLDALESQKTSSELERMKDLIDRAFFQESYATLALASIAERGIC